MREYQAFPHIRFVMKGVLSASKGILKPEGQKACHEKAAKEERF